MKPSAKPRSSKADKSATLSVVEQLRTNTRLHQAILDGLQRGVNAADSNVFFMSAKMTTNLLRFIAMNSELARVLIEDGFHPHVAGISFLFEKFCPVTQHDGADPTRQGI